MAQKCTRRKAVCPFGVNGYFLVRQIKTGWRTFFHHSRCQKGAAEEPWRESVEHYQQTGNPRKKFDDACHHGWQMGTPRAIS